MTPHRFSADEYYKLGALGILDERTELIAGIITDMEPITPFHASIGDALGQIFHEAAEDRYRVRSQAPIDLGPQNQPQPDLVLCRPGRYRDRHPGPADIFLVVEISDTGLSYELGQKLSLYKDAAIQEYWVVDLRVTRVHCLCVPDYEHQILIESASPATWPDIKIDLQELFR